VRFLWWAVVVALLVSLGAMMTVAPNPKYYDPTHQHDAGLTWVATPTEAPKLPGEPTVNPTLRRRKPQ
jgi:hypothetical protein